MAEPIGVVGLGVMGSAMARNLIKAGHQLLGFDIDPSRVSTLADIGGEPAKSADEVAAVSDLMILSLPATSALASVAAEIAEQDRPGPPCLETGTAVPVYEALSEAGLGDFDATALCRYLEDLGGLER